MTSSNGKIFRVTGHLCGEFTGPGEFPTQRPVTWRFDVFFDLRLNKRLSKQPWGWWFETLSWSLWRHCNARMFPRHCLNCHTNCYRANWLFRHHAWWFLLLTFWKLNHFEETLTIFTFSLVSWLWDGVVHRNMSSLKARACFCLYRQYHCCWCSWCTSSLIVRLVRQER